MGKKLFVWTTAVMIIFGLVFLTSCARQEVKTDTAELTQPQEDMEDMAARAEAEAEAMAEEARAAAERAREIEEQALRMERQQVRQTFENENINYDFDRSVLTAKAQEILKSKAAWLRDNPDVNVVIEGHCDERGTAEYNLALGDRRAKSARKFLVDMGINAKRLTTISYGEERPLDPRSNEDAWAKNRRASFVIK